MDRKSTVPVWRFPAPDVLVTVTDGAGFPEASQGISASLVNGLRNVGFSETIYTRSITCK